jgi:2-keto-4-pentenoate hydratase/2-oxohepta-3-ene-1,7-dioic acid hydratase in catechol pathway
LRAGDVVAIGPIVPGSETILLQQGDEFHLSVENLGAIATKIA